MLKYRTRILDESSKSVFRLAACSIPDILGMGFYQLMLSRFVIG